MRVFQVRWCPFAHRARIVLEEKGIPYEVEYFERGKRPAVLERVSPDARSPTLFDSAANRWVWDSLGVIEYLEDHYSEVPLMPREVEARERASVTMREVDTKLVPTIGPCVMELVHKAPGTQDEAKVRECVARFREELVLWQARLGGQTFLTGDAFTLADIALYTPIVSMVRLLGDEGDIPEPLGPLRTWRDRIAARPSTAY